MAHLTLLSGERITADFAFGPAGLASQLAVQEYARTAFRERVRLWLNLIRLLLAGLPRNDREERSISRTR